MTEIRFGEKITLVNHRDMPARNVECIECDWQGLTPDLRDIPLILAPHLELPPGACPNCGAACRETLALSLAYIRQNYEELRLSEEGARMGRAEAQRQLAKAQSDIVRLEAECAQLRREIIEARGK